MTILCPLSVALRSQLNAKISLSFTRYFENDHSRLRILVDSRLENQRIWRFVLNSIIALLCSPLLARVLSLSEGPSPARLQPPVGPS